MRRFLNGLNESIVILDRENKIIFENQALLDRLRMKRGTLEGERIKGNIRIDPDEIIIKHADGGIDYGTYESYPSAWEGEICSWLIIRWEDKLPEHTALLEQLLDRMQKWIFIKDVHNKYIYANQYCAEQCQLSKEDFLKWMDHESKKNPHVEMTYKNDEYVKRTKNSYVYEMVREIDGVKRFYEVKKYPLLGKAGDVHYIATSVKDITIIKNIEEQISEQFILFTKEEHQDRVTIKEVNEDIFPTIKRVFEQYDHTKQFNILLYNEEQSILEPYFHQQEYDFGISEGAGFQITKEKIQAFIDGEYDKVNYVNVKQFHKKKKDHWCYIVQLPIVYQQEFKGLLCLTYLEYPYAEVIENEIVGRVCKQIGGIIKYIELSRILEKEFEARNALEKELELFLAVSSDFLIKVDSKGRFKEISKGAVDLLGWSKEEFMNMTWEEMIHPDELEKTKKVLCQSHVKESCVNRYRCADGSYKWIRWQGGIKDSEGCILGTGEDVTREKDLETREQLIEKALQLEQVRSEFFANLSHEFKTPITIILSALQMLDKSMPVQEIKEGNDVVVKKYMNSIKQNSYRLLRLVNNLIDVTKIDAGFYTLYLKDWNIISVIEDVVLSVVEYSEGKGITLIFDTEVEEEVIACDSDQIERIILNLLGNAIKYNTESGKIDVMIGLEAQYVVIRITDTGVGIPPEKLEFIFERFVRAQDVMTRMREGSGIGLALVKALVEMHQGSVTAKSEVGVGSTFEVRLPRRQLKQDEVQDVEDDRAGTSKLERCSIEFSDIYDF